LSKIAVVHPTDLVNQPGTTLSLRIELMLWPGNSPLTLSPWHAGHAKKCPLVFENSSHFPLNCYSQSLLRKDGFLGRHWAAIYTYCNTDVQEHNHLWKVILQAAYMVS